MEGNSMDNGEFDSLKDGITYYGVYIPPEARDYETPDQLVFTKASEALAVIKKYRKARFKSFANEEAAIEFTLYGSEIGFKDSNPVVTVPAEKGITPLRSPSIDELRELKKCIESGNVSRVSLMLNSFPRILLSSGDTPAILQEGCRYNALHIAAKAGHADVVGIVLRLVSDPDFVRLMYNDVSLPLNNAVARSKILLDRYLNTPDKGNHDTPLHFAAKWGQLAAMQILISYPECNKLSVNKFGQTPYDVICDRGQWENEVIKKEMQSLLRLQYFVPVIKPEDDSEAPSLGGPIAPGETVTSSQNYPVKISYKVRAMAGPFESKLKAEEFRCIWKSVIKTNRQYASCVRSDPNKGLEYVGRILVAQHHINWNEFWDFLGMFVDLKSPFGLTLFDKYLFKQFNPPNQPRVNNGLGYSIKSLTEQTQNMYLSDYFSPSVPTSYLEAITNKDYTTVFEMSVQVYSCRVATNLSRNFPVGRWVSKEIRRFSLFLTSCVNDFRYKDVDFRKAHAYYALQVVAQLQSQNPNNVGMLVRAFLRDRHASSDSDDEGPDYDYAMTCIGRFMHKYYFQLRNKGPVLPEELKMPPDYCSCSVPSSLKRPRRITYLMEDDPDETDEEEYWTPLGSPQKEENEQTVPDDLYISTTDSDDFEKLEDLQQPTFIYGSSPSQMDAAALHALSFADPELVKKHLYIQAWMSACQSYQVAFDGSNVPPPPPSRPRIVFSHTSSNPPGRI